MKKQKFKITVGDTTFTGECDGTLVRESWRYVMPKKAERATFKGPQAIKRLTLTIFLDSNVVGEVTRPPDPELKQTKKTKRKFGRRE